MKPKEKIAILAIEAVLMSLFLVGGVSAISGIEWSGNHTTQGASSAYNATSLPNFGFQMLWTPKNDSNGTTNWAIPLNVTFETNITGSRTNYTNYTAIAVANTSVGLHYINFTLGQTAGVGTYFYRWYGENMTTDDYTRQQGNGTDNVTFAITNGTAEVTDTSITTPVSYNEIMRAYANFSDTSNTLINSSCSVIYDGTNYAMSWNVSEARQESVIFRNTRDVTGPDYAYVNCSNANYSDVTRTSLEVMSYASSGGAGTGGGGAGQPPPADAPVPSPIIGLPVISLPTFTLPGLPTISLPQISLPTFTFPQLSLPSFPNIGQAISDFFAGFQLPQLRLPQINLPTI